MLLAAGRPVSVEQLLELFEEIAATAGRGGRAALADLQQSYEGRGIELREVASGWRVQVRPQYADVVSRLWQERPSRYSRALLETLALIAYRQPITRGEIEDIRGVTVSTTIMRTLHERGWIRVVGHREVPGRPELLGTTREFLDYFGLKSLDDLPTLAELRDLEDIREQLDLPEAIAAAAVALAHEEVATLDDDSVAPRRTDRRAGRRRQRRRPLSERLHKLLAQHGIGSRRQVEAWIREGRVLVNGQPADGRPGAARPGDRVVVDGKDVTRLLAVERKLQVIAYHKPAGEMLRSRAGDDREGVEMKLPALHGGRWVAINALGFGEDGLLLLSSEGRFALAVARKGHELAGGVPRARAAARPGNGLARNADGRRRRRAARGVHRRRAGRRQRHQHVVQGRRCAHRAAGCGPRAVRCRGPQGEPHAAGEVGADRAAARPAARPSPRAGRRGPGRAVCAGRPRPRRHRSQAAPHAASRARPAPQEDYCASKRAPLTPRLSGPSRYRNGPSTSSAVFSVPGSSPGIRLGPHR